MSWWNDPPDEDIFGPPQYDREADDISLYRTDTGVPTVIDTMMWEEWFQVLMFRKDELDYYYGVDHFTIIGQLQALGLWTDIDWERFRVEYAGVE